MSFLDGMGHTFLSLLEPQCRVFYEQRPILTWLCISVILIRHHNIGVRAKQLWSKKTCVKLYHTQGVSLQKEAKEEIEIYLEREGGRERERNS